MHIVKHNDSVMKVFPEHPVLYPKVIIIEGLEASCYDMSLYSKCPLHHIVSIYFLWAPN